MEENASDMVENTTSIVKIDEITLEETQLTEQLYNSAGLDPVVDAGLKDYDKTLQRENKLINKVLGPRGSDIRGYGGAVARRTALAVYTLLNRQYGGKVGNMRSYIMTLEEDRDRANTRYDDLMGRVVGILGDEYRELRSDSKVFMEKLTTVLGEDIKESKIDHGSLAERLADIDGLRERIKALDRGKQQLAEKYESQIIELRNEHKEEVGGLKSQIVTKDNEHKAEVGDLKAQIVTKDNEHKAEVGDLKAQIVTKDNEHKAEATNLKAQIDKLNAKVEELESKKTTLTTDLARSRDDYNQLKTAITNLVKTVADEGIGKKLSDELYSFVLNDSKVPDMVIEGVGKFIDFNKYLGLAVERGAKDVTRRIEDILGIVR